MSSAAGNDVGRFLMRSTAGGARLKVRCRQTDRQTKDAGLKVLRAGGGKSRTRPGFSTKPGRANSIANKTRSAARWYRFQSGCEWKQRSSMMTRLTASYDAASVQKPSGRNCSFTELLLLPTNEEYNCYIPYTCVCV